MWKITKNVALYTTVDPKTPSSKRGLGELKLVTVEPFLLHRLILGTFSSVHKTAVGTFSSVHKISLCGKKILDVLNERLIFTIRLEQLTTYLLPSLGWKKFPLYVKYIFYCSSLSVHVTSNLF